MIKSASKAKPTTMVRFDMVGQYRRYRSRSRGHAFRFGATGIDRAAVLAFGDMRNDLPMLRWAGRGIAVANANPEVLAEVTDVTKSNSEDGVARALASLILNESGRP